MAPGRSPGRPGGPCRESGSRSSARPGPGDAGRVRPLRTAPPTCDCSRPKVLAVSFRKRERPGGRQPNVAAAPEPPQAGRRRGGARRGFLMRITETRIRRGRLSRGRPRRRPTGRRQAEPVSAAAEPVVARPEPVAVVAGTSFGWPPGEARAAEVPEEKRAARRAGAGSSCPPAPQLVPSSPEVTAVAQRRAGGAPRRRRRASEGRALIEAAEALLNQQEGRPGRGGAASCRALSRPGVSVRRQRTPASPHADLKDADIKDTLQRFSELTAAEHRPRSGRRGTVTG